MAMTEYKFDRDGIRDLVEQRRRGLRANRGLSDLLGFGLGVVSSRLQKDRRRYLDYGPYWPALKQLLHSKGYDYGAQSDPLVAVEYRGETPEETLIMADEFRTQYLATQFIYTNRFMLDADSGEFWTLYDADMESPV